MLALCGDVELNPGPQKLMLMTQNCRGLQDYNKLRLLIKSKNAIFSKERAVLALQETHLMNDDMIKWSGNFVISCSPSPHSAGCVTYFNDYVRIIEVKHVDNNGHGHVIVVEGLTMHTAIVANVYSPVRSIGREQDEFYNNLINIIEEFEGKYLFNEPNLIILGDFNLPLETHANYHSNETEVRRARTLAGLLEGKGLIDCWKDSDARFTYKTTKSRLDRIMYRVDYECSEKLETEWTFVNSDHCLLKATLNPARVNPVLNRVVSLPTYLLENSEMLQMMRTKMAEMVNDTIDHWEPRVRLEYLKMCLRTVTGEVVKYHSKRINDELEGIQKNICWRMNRINSLPLHAHAENNLQLELLFSKRNLILDERSKKLAEKAKTKWFYEGEKANKYFLNLLNKRRGVSRIERLNGINGDITDENEINVTINNFYKELYERGELNDTDSDASFYDNIVKVSDLEASKVISPLTKEEIYLVLRECKDSAPGPDGIPYSYYKHFWDFFGDTLALAWSDAVLGGSLPDSHKVSILRLLPKIGKDPTKLTNWRPITLSNCDHKLITKCLAKRLTNALKPCLHPNQTAYIPGKQIQDNLRIINIVNERSPESLIVSLDAKKAFDSVSHDYIRKTLIKFGLHDFVPIFNLLYNQQRVKINVNDKMLEGYEIKNGVKQGDSLSCILFIMCMDPVIRNIENNVSIGRTEIQNYPFPKVLAYADDITCIIENDIQDLQEIFNEYGRLSKASGLVLNADKTEILDGNESQFRICYSGEHYLIKGAKSVKINGVYFNKDLVQMKNDNFIHLTNKIENMLTGWRARNLSLLGKILIYKTFGMSQVIYILSVATLNQNQYKKIDTMFNNFLWGRELAVVTVNSRIGRERLNTPIEYGGFGMIQYERILEGIYCRQLSKMYDQTYDHPIKFISIKNDIHFATGKSLTSVADDIAIKAHNIMYAAFTKHVKKLTNQQIVEDSILTSLLGAIDLGLTIKPRWSQSVEATRLLHVLRCTNIKDIIEQGRIAVKLSTKILKSFFLRIVKALWHANTQCEVITNEKFVTPKGTYKLIYTITSKEFRELANGQFKVLPPKNPLELDVQSDDGRYLAKNYFNTIKRLSNTRHKNTLLRIWNGDSLSYSRLVHLRVVENNLCPNCGGIDTPTHMLIECHVAMQTWDRLITKIPKNPNINMIEYAVGLYDDRIELSIKAEILKMLMHGRNMDAEAIHRKLKNYFLVVYPKNIKIRRIFS